MKKKFLIFTGSLDSSGGGVSTIVNQLFRALSVDNLEFDCYLFGFGETSDFSHARIFQFKAFSFPIFNKFNLSFSALLALYKLRPDVIYLNGHWQFQSLLVFVYLKLFPNTTFFYCPQGMLDESVFYSGSPLKRLIWILYERRLLCRARVAIVHSRKESEGIKSLCGSSAATHIVNNGFERWGTFRQCDIDLKRKFASKRFIFLGRIVEKKSVLELVEAVASIAGLFRDSGFFLDVYGWGDKSYLNAIQFTISKLEISDIVFLKGPVYDEFKRDKIVNSFASVLPSKSEGQPMTVVESLSLATPVIISKECNYDYLFESDICIQTSYDVADIAKSLAVAISLDYESYISMALSSLEYVEKFHSWDKFARILLTYAEE